MGIAPARRRAPELSGRSSTRHTRNCSACAAYVADIGALTVAIRSAELERLPRPVVLPLRRSFACGDAALQARAATAAVLAITAGLSLQIGRSSSSQRAGEVPGRLPREHDPVRPNSESDMLIRAPKLAASKATAGRRSPARPAHRHDVTIGMPRRLRCRHDGFRFADHLALLNSTTSPVWRTRSSTTVSARGTVTTRAAGRLDSPR